MSISVNERVDNVEQPLAGYPCGYLSRTAGRQLFDVDLQFNFFF